MDPKEWTQGGKYWIAILTHGIHVAFIFAAITKNELSRMVWEKSSFQFNLGEKLFNFFLDENASLNLFQSFYVVQLMIATSV